MEYKEESWESAVNGMRLLFSLHWKESENNQDEIPLDVDYEKYAALSKMNMLHLVTARDDGVVVGYIWFLVHSHLHHKTCLSALSDTIYLHPEYRKGFAGINLIKCALKGLKARDVRLVCMSVKLHSDFGHVLEHLGFAPVERLYTKVL